MIPHNARATLFPSSPLLSKGKESSLSVDDYKELNTIPSLWPRENILSSSRQKVYTGVMRIIPSKAER